MHGFGYPTLRDFFSFGRLLNGKERQRNTASYSSAEFLVAALRGNASLLTLTQKREEAFPNEVGAISDLGSLVFIANDSPFIDICTLLPFTFNLILGVSTFFPSHVFLKCTVILKVSFGGLLGREDQLNYAVTNVFEVIVLYGLRCLVSAGCFAEFDTS